jgi:hypothetical protein
MKSIYLIYGVLCSVLFLGCGGGQPLSEQGTTETEYFSNEKKDFLMSVRTLDGTGYLTVKSQDSDQHYTIELWDMNLTEAQKQIIELTRLDEILALYPLTNHRFVTLIKPADAPDNLVNIVVIDYMQNRILNNINVENLPDDKAASQLIFDSENNRLILGSFVLGLDYIAPVGRFDAQKPIEQQNSGYMTSTHLWFDDQVAYDAKNKETGMLPGNKTSTYQWLQDMGNAYLETLAVTPGEWEGEGDGYNISLSLTENDISYYQFRKDGVNCYGTMRLEKSDRKSLIFREFNGEAFCGEAIVKLTRISANSFQYSVEELLQAGYHPRKGIVTFSQAAPK